MSSAALAVVLIALTSCSIPPLKEYAYPAWGFAVSFRAPPTEISSPERTAGGPPGGFKAESNNAGRDFFVSVADGSASPKSDDQILNEFPLALAQGGTLKSQTYIASGPVTGREVLIDKPGLETMRTRIFMFHRRLYEVSARSSLGPDDPEVKTFLESFRLVDG